MRKLLIFGNGLGRALDNEFFDLAPAMKFAWDKLNDDEKLAFSSLKGIDADTGPSDEDQLLPSQVALVACQVIRSVADHPETWLAKKTNLFPIAAKKLAFYTARYFHDYDPGKCPSWPNFVSKLQQFISSTKSHVATLNYDTLLYDPFNDSFEDSSGNPTKVCNGYSGSLIDGFRRVGFKSNFLTRRNPDNLGYYMHLHGSPLFYTKDDNHMKLKRPDFNEYVDNPNLVLSHGSMKPMVIESSEILKTYWGVLDEAIEESEELILFGYSGSDEHLNRRIASNQGSRPILVVEWQDDEETDAERQSYWEKKISNKNIHLIRRKNILDFNVWTDPATVAVTSCF